MEITSETIQTPGSVEDPEMERSLWIHDEILLKVLIEATDEVALTPGRIMEEAGRVLLKTAPVEADVVVVGNITCLKSYNQEGFSPGSFDRYQWALSRQKLYSWSNILSDRSYPDK